MIIVIRRSAVILCGVVAVALILSVLLRSLLAVPTVSEVQELSRIVVDAGHGNFDGGAESPNGVLEKDLNLVIAKKLEARLTDDGFYPVMTRTDDRGIHDESLENIAEKKKSDMYKRRDIMNTCNAELFVSIHMNTFQDASCSGPQVFYSSNREESEYLAAAIQKELNRLSANVREIKMAGQGIYLLKTAKIPAVLVECGFLSNPLDEAKLCTDEYQERLVNAIAEGIETYLGEAGNKRSEDTPSPGSEPE